MKINISFRDFKKNHTKKKHQVLFRSRTCKEYYKVENLFKFLLAKKNSFIFESVEKGKIKGRYTIIGLNPDKSWDINKNIVTINNLGKITKVKTEPLVFINKLIKDFNIKIPKKLPSMSSMLVGYFSYDIIRFIEKIPDKCKDDLKIPDVRLSRPTNLVIYDNLKKKIYYIENIYSDQKIKNYDEKYESIKSAYYEHEQDYLATVNVNGIWIKEKNFGKNYIIRSKNLDEQNFVVLSYAEATEKYLDGLGLS